MFVCLFHYGLFYDIFLSTTVLLFLLQLAEVMVKRDERLFEEGAR